MTTLSRKCDGHDFHIAFEAVLNLMFVMMRYAADHGEDDVFVCVRNALATMESETPTDAAGVH